MKRMLSREFLIVAIPATLIALAAIWFALKYVKPAPPKSFVISTASKGSPYYELAVKYRDLIATNGIKVEVRESQGSFDNLKALLNPQSDVQVGIVQGGVSSSFDIAGLSAMGRLLVEPVWIFYRGSERFERLTQLRGKRIMIGPDGGGTNVLAKQLLAANGIDEQNSTLIAKPLPEYIDAFSQDAADVGFLVVGAEAKTIQRLLNTPDLHLMSMSQADALIQRYPFLTRMALREGVVDFAKNIPPEDTALIATRAALVIRDDLHPALVNLLALAALHVQGQPAAAGQTKLFPITSEMLAADDAEFPVSADARRVYKSGPTLLQRILPFWLATLLDRALVLILPILGIVLPLLRIVPFLYNWRMRRRILLWYKALKMLERDLVPPVPAEVIEKKEQDLDRIEEGVRRISVPIQFAADLYNLRDHVEFVRRRLALAKGGVTRETGTPLASVVMA